MNRVLRALLSLVLIAAGIFGLFTGINGVKDALNIKDYKEADAEHGKAQINDELLPGIQQLRENFDVYMEGVKTFEEGKLAYADGQAQLAAGAAQLAAGEAQLAAGKAELAANTEAYNRGKELQGTLNTVNGLVAQYEATKNAIVNGTSDLLHNNPLDPLDIGGTAYDNAMRTAEQIFLSGVRSVLSTDLITNTLGMAIDIPADAKNFPSWFQGFVAHANSELARYEDGQRQVAAGEAQLAQGYADYAAGQQQLAEGAQQLADGEKQLAEFENGQVTLTVGLARLLTQPAYQNNGVGAVYPNVGDVPGKLFDTLLENIEESDRGAVADAIYPGFWDSEDTSTWGFPKSEGTGDEVCPSVLSILRGSDYLGESFNPATDIFLQENGGVMVRNGYPVVNLDVAEKIANAGLEYIDNYQTKAVTNEVMGKAISYVLLLVGAVAGILAGLFGLISVFGKGLGAARVFGCISLLAALAGLVLSLIKGAFKGYAFGVTEGAENPWGHIPTEIRGKDQLLALLALACAALLFFLVCAFAKKKAKKAAQPVYVQQPVYAAPDQPVAQPVYAAPVQSEADAAAAAAAAAAQQAAAAAQAAAEAAQQAAD